MTNVILNPSILSNNAQREYNDGPNALLPAAPKSQDLYAQDLYAKVSHRIPAIEWPVFAGDINAIQR